MSLGIQAYDLPGQPAKTGPKLRLLNTRRAATVAHMYGDDESAAMLDRITKCKTPHLGEMNRLKELSDRFDNLYYPVGMTDGGADHWMDDPVLQEGGQAHISINTYPVYVDIPAALQSVTPIENVIASDPEAQGGSQIAAAVERVYFSWKDQVDFELLSHKLAVVKGLYGRSAWKVWWDPDRGIPVVGIIEQPRNLWLDWTDTTFQRLNWAIYAYEVAPETITEEWGLQVTSQRVKGEDDTEYDYPAIVPPNMVATQTYSPPMRDWQNNIELVSMVEVHDYWYRKPKGKVVFGKKTTMETWNAIVVGNVMVKNSAMPEYEGQLPFIPVFNTYIPGLPDGRSNLYDIEQLMREKDTRMSQLATLIAKAIKGKYWQLVGPEADRLPQGFELIPDKVAVPGAGNRVESVDPWMPEFQAEHFLDRLDRELQDVSGLNDLLRGLAPAQVLSSSKAIAGLVANYETRITMPLELHYRGRLATWELVTVIWQNKGDARLKDIFSKAKRVVQKKPSLTPRDDLETMTMALNALNGKVWSQRRAMDATGVEDPEHEQADIREERTDASLFPADVLQQATLMSTLMQLAQMQAQMQAAQQPQPPGAGGAPGAPGAPGATPGAAQAAALQAGGGQQGTTSLNGPGEQPVPGAQPGNAQDAAMAALQGGAPAQALGPGYNAQLQTQLTSNGKPPQSRVLLQQPIGPGK